MQRCIQLARLGAGSVAPNPMVGSVLVYDDRIIGEGYHELYGKAHAEVNCIKSVREEDLPLIEKSTLYVSLEPCAHYGKTPPCADLIIEKKIPHVVVGCRDSFVEVDGKGIQKLRAAGIKVEVGILEKECLELNKRFFTFHTQHRPYIILKWAQTHNGIIGSYTKERLMISNQASNHLVHQWRSQEAAIMVGTRTAVLDNPSLTTRLWPGANPLRIVVDMNLSLPLTLQLFDNAAPTLVFNQQRNSIDDFKDKSFIVNKQTAWYQLAADVSMVPQVLNALYQLNIQSLVVEGGARLIQSFIDEALWDEARVITNESLFVEEGVPAPRLKKAALRQIDHIETDSIRYYNHQPLSNQ